MSNELKELDELVCWDPGVVNCFSRNYFVRLQGKGYFHFPSGPEQWGLTVVATQEAQEQPQRSTTIEGIFP